MTAVLNIVLPVLASFCVVAALVFLVRAFNSRKRIPRQVYGVGQVEARRTMQIGFLRAIAAFVVGALLLGTWAGVLTFSPLEPPSEDGQGVIPTQLQIIAPTETAVSATMTPTVTMTISASPTTAPTATNTVPAATETPRPTPTATPTPAPATATVSSGVGVYLRAEPTTDGEQIEWVLEGTLLILLPGRVQADEFEWQQVRSPAGNEGWVAVPFIQYNN